MAQLWTFLLTYKGTDFCENRLVFSASERERERLAAVNTTTKIFVSWNNQLIVDEPWSNMCEFKQPINRYRWHDDTDIESSSQEHTYVYMYMIIFDMNEYGREERWERQNHIPLLAPSSRMYHTNPVSIRSLHDQIKKKEVLQTQYAASPESYPLPVWNTWNSMQPFLGAALRS